MLILNPEFYNTRSFIHFIDASTNALVLNNQAITMQKEYWLFYYIKEDVISNFYSLQRADINLDFLGFPTIKRTTRHAIEAYIDLFNLCHDPEYIEVMKYCANKENKIAEKYGCYRYKNQFTIHSKIQIAKEIHGADMEHLLYISKDSNSYVHPNVFVDVIGQLDIAKKDAVLRELLMANFLMLHGAYNLLIQKFYNDKQPYLNCMGCAVGNCRLCYKNAVSNFQQLLNDPLFIEVRPQQPYFM